MGHTGTHRSQQGLVKECTLNDSSDPHRLEGIFLNQAVRGSLGTQLVKIALIFLKALEQQLPPNLIVMCLFVSPVWVAL